ncbi:Acyl-CoA thioesterase [Nannocystis exedens]|uniref:Acyl-CoA thioesterase n=1 Tax=Nannocystis exedens TaxID=54 RepID=A0A1I1SJD0_9BACT|nr:thioesterase family protein [Nannocystis exedens]PCC75536.1 acyl-CoA thioesterase-like protein [Nannocystis exedens]SFD46597.1 Acyl-CoA thioesterase [Nannocystis exedens]
MTHPADLARDTAVVRSPEGPARYVLDLPPHWNYFMPSGGALMTAALRAIAAEIDDPTQKPLSATAIFCVPVGHGPLVIDVVVLRRGQLATQVRAALSAAGGPSPGLEVVATFGRERPGPELGLVRAPVLPGPHELPPIDARGEGGGSPPFFRNYDCRRALGQPWWRGDRWAPGLDRAAYWYRHLVPQTLPDGQLDPLALPPLIDTMPPAMFQLGGPALAGTIAPSLDLTVHWLEDTRREWLLTHAHCRRARAGYATADIEIWDDEGRLVAWGNQRMLLRRRPDLPPSR